MDDLLAVPMRARRDPFGAPLGRPRGRFLGIREQPTRRSVVWIVVPETCHPEVP